MKTSKILVTGGAGFIGSHLCEKLLDQGHTVIAFDMSDGLKIEHLWGHERFQFVRDSILNEEILEEQFKDIDIVFHFAAVADPKRYVMDPLGTLEVDLKGTLNLLKVASRCGVKVMFASTSEIYGKNPNVPWSETSERVLGSTHIHRWCYATAKAAGEHYCYAYYEQKKMPFVIFRFFNVYGPRLDDLGSGRVIPMFLKQFLENKPLYIHDQGKQTRTFVYVDDVIEAITKLAFTPKAEGQVFNIGSTEETSILKLADLMRRIGHFQSEFVFVPYKDAFGPGFEDIPRRVPDVRKIYDAIGWKSTTPLEVGLQKTLEYYSQYK
ncbi:MAG: NAD-dependent epimerase/dehydratase family protein [Deltaproteobacteria bacterium]|nr:NAD-dependent epimerase/dehydratase family protein [Deltaproteobacteria bacterium]